MIHKWNGVSGYPTFQTNNIPPFTSCKELETKLNEHPQLAIATLGQSQY